MTEKKQKKVVLNIESDTKGHETLSLGVEQAVDRVGTETTQNGKWLYCDGKFVSADTATSEGRQRLGESLVSARNNVLSGTLLGG